VGNQETPHNTEHLPLFFFFFGLTELVAKRRCYRTNRPPLAARSRPSPSPLVWSHQVAPQHSSAMVRCPLSRRHRPSP
jgi:hypothetical protein